MTKEIYLMSPCFALSLSSQPNLQKIFQTSLFLIAQASKFNFRINPIKLIIFTIFGQTNKAEIQGKWTENEEKAVHQKHDRVTIKGLHITINAKKKKSNWSPTYKELPPLSKSSFELSWAWSSSSFFLSSLFLQ